MRSMARFVVNLLIIISFIYSMGIMGTRCRILRLYTMDASLPHCFTLVYVCFDKRFSEKKADRKESHTNGQQRQD